MLFDTHTHLQFKAFENNLDQTIQDSFKAGIKYINIVGTDIPSSKKAIEIASKYENIFAVIGIHPHHIFSYQDSSDSLEKDLKKLEELAQEEKVIAIGETGMDRQMYGKTKYPDYKITDKFIELQKKAFEFQIKLAIKYKKSLVIHNISAVDELLEILEKNWDKFLSGRSVFHCAEPNQKLLDFAIKNNIYIGIDGDITEYKEKQEFVKKIPLELLVLETDSPFLTPLGFQNPNVPVNLNYICEYISKILKIDNEKLREITFKNSQKLFDLSNRN